MIENLRLLLAAIFRPPVAFSGILDRGSLLFASCAALAAGFAETHLVSGPPIAFYMPLLVLAGVYVPGVLLIATLLGRIGSVGVVFQRDYATLLTSAAMAWAAAQIVYVAGAVFVPESALLPLYTSIQLYFGALMFFAVRMTFGVGSGTAIAIVALSWIPVVVAGFLWAPLSFILRLLASPFFLFYAWYYLSGEVRNLGSGLRQGQNFRRMLDAAALNPHDADAQYQLGLIYQQRRRYSDAIARFENAVRIDPTEADAHFQLGRIAREQGRLPDALIRFETVLKLDERHSSSEVHRELGATYLALNRVEDARRELEIYTDRRPYDPEGQFYFGEVLEQLGEKEAATTAYAAAVEADRTAPRYRRRFTARWSRAAQKQLRKV